MCLAALGSALAPAGAHADASRMNCTTSDLRVRSAWGGPMTWPYWNLFHRDPEATLTVHADGTARCTASNGVVHQATLTVRDASLHATCGFTTDTSQLTGTLDFSFATGLKDRRPFTTGYDTGVPGGPTMSVDGATASFVSWNFSDEPCGSSYTDVDYIDVVGSFSVPVSKTNPKLFVRPPASPGHPDPIATNAAGDRIYVGSFTSATAALAGTAPPDTSPSKVWAYNPSGSLVTSWTISGQTLTKAHGLTGIAVDSAGRLYLTDIDPPRVIRLDPATGAQSTYASFRDLVPCDAGGPAGDCSQESPDFGNRPPLPNGAAFGPDGSLYVTDTTQGGIWKVPPGGGRPVLWLADSRFESYIGPNGIRLMADQRTLIFVFSNSQPPGSTDQLQGAIYKVAINPDGTPGALTRFWTGGTNEGPDSLALAQSGNVYVALAGDGLRTGFVVLSPTGVELARRSGPTDRLSADIAYDTVADVAFVGTRAFFTNSSNFGNNAANYAIFEYDVGDTGQPVLRPTVP